MDSSENKKAGPAAVRRLSHLTPERVRSLIHYEPETGIFTWLRRTNENWTNSNSRRVFNSNFAGKEAGHKHPYGYRVIRIDGCTIRAHRLAFIYMTGSQPDAEVDHMNGVRDDNRWTNLRTVTRTEQNRNGARYRTNKSGVAGVFWNKKNKKWQAMIGVGGKQKHLGYFPSIDAAAKARADAETAYGYSSQHGRERNPEYDYAALS